MFSKFEENNLFSKKIKQFLKLFFIYLSQKIYHHFIIWICLIDIRLLTMIMFSNLYPLSSTRYMNLDQALFLNDLITDKEIDVCSHIFHILAKTVERTASRNYLPFYLLISKILKLKGMHPSEDEHPYPQPSPINIRTLLANMSHTKKSTKQESHATPRSSSSTSHAYDEQLDNIMAALQEINTKISGLATIMHS